MPLVALLWAFLAFLVLGLATGYILVGIALFLAWAGLAYLSFLFDGFLLDAACRGHTAARSTVSPILWPLLWILLGGGPLLAVSIVPPAPSPALAAVARVLYAPWGLPVPAAGGLGHLFAYCAAFQIDAMAAVAVLSLLAWLLASLVHHPVSSLAALARHALRLPGGRLAPDRLAAHAVRAGGLLVLLGLSAAALGPARAAGLFPLLPAYAAASSAGGTLYRKFFELAPAADGPSEMGWFFDLVVEGVKNACVGSPVWLPVILAFRSPPAPLLHVPAADRLAVLWGAAALAFSLPRLAALALRSFVRLLRRLARRSPGPSTTRGFAAASRSAP